MGTMVEYGGRQVDFSLAAREDSIGECGGNLMRCRHSVCRRGDGEESGTGQECSDETHKQYSLWCVPLTRSSRFSADVCSIDLLNRCQTPMGSRALMCSILQPPNRESDLVLVSKLGFTSQRSTSLSRGSTLCRVRWRRVF